MKLDQKFHVFLLSFFLIVIAVFITSKNHFLQAAPAAKTIEINESRSRPVQPSIINKTSTTLSAANVSSGQFGQNTGGGIYSFPGSLGIGTTSPGRTLDVNASGPGNGIRNLGSGGYTDYAIGRSLIEGYWGIANTAAVYSEFSSAGDIIFSAKTGNLILTAKNGTGAIKFGTGVTDTEKMRLSNAGGLSLGSSYVRTDAGAGNIIIDGSLGIGTKAPTEKLEVNGGVKLNTASAKPGCDTAKRGTMWFTQGTGGTKDSFEVCAKDGSDSYAWRSLY